METCNHDLSANSSLVKSPLRRLVFPYQCGYFCLVCKKVFVVTRDENGIDHLLEKKAKRQKR